MRMLKLAALSFVIAIANPIRLVHAGPVRVLPDFDVTAIDGSVTHTSQILRDGKWLLVFVRPNCPACSMLLASLDADTTQDGSRVAVIVKALTPAVLASLKSQYPHLGHSQWFADVHAKAAATLDIPASPTTLGMRGGQVAWRLTGAVSALPTGELDTKALSVPPSERADQPEVRQRAILNGWLRQP